MSDFMVEGYWRQIQELQKEVERLKKHEQWVKDFVQYGFRIDTHPTRMFMIHRTPEVMQAQTQEYQWWVDYVTGAERRLLESARNVLKGE